MKIEMQIILEINNQAEMFYEDAVRLGNHAAYALKARHRSQLTGLENVAESAFKATDVVDYVKRQTARFSYWRQNFPNNDPEDKDAARGFGERLKDYLENELKMKRNLICDNKLELDDQDDKYPHLRRQVYLLLIRQFMRQMVAQYEYRVNVENLKKGA